MAFLTINCPTCASQLRLPVELEGKKVKCPSCKNVFTATSDGEPLSGVQTGPSKITPRDDVPPRPSRDDYDDDDSSRRSPRKSRDDDDDDDRPRFHSKSKYDDDVDDRVSPRSRSRGDYNDDDRSIRKSNYHDDDDDDFVSRRSSSYRSIRARRRPDGLTPGNGLGIAAMIVGIFSIPCICLCPVVGAITGITGAILGFVGLSSEGRGMAIAGIATGCCGTVLSIAWFVAMIVLQVNLRR